jgi:hypothetical protein
MPEWIQRLITIAQQVVPKDFFGQIEINIQGGGVSNVNVKQSYPGLRKDTAK